MDEIKIIITTPEGDEGDIQFDFKNGTTEDYINLLTCGIVSLCEEEGVDPISVFHGLFHGVIEEVMEGKHD